MQTISFYWLISENLSLIMPCMWSWFPAAGQIQDGLTAHALTPFLHLIVWHNPEVEQFNQSQRFSSDSCDNI